MTQVLGHSFSIVNQLLDLSLLLNTLTVFKYTFQLQYHKCTQGKSHGFALAASKGLQVLGGDFRWLPAMGPTFLIPP